MKRYGKAGIEIESVTRGLLPGVSLAGVHAGGQPAHAARRPAGSLAQINSNGSPVAKVDQSLKNAKPKNSDPRVVLALEAIRRRRAARGHGVEPFTAPGFEIPSVPPVTVHQHTTVDGVLSELVIRRGGAAITLRDLEGKVVQGEVLGVARVKALSAHLMGNSLRVSGNGKWMRVNDAWRLVEFSVEAFEVLDETPLDQVLYQLRGLPNNGWATFENPLNVWKQMRGADGHL
jgi:hypothetical protein